MFNAAAERNISPTFVDSVIFSRMTIRLALAQIDLTVGRVGRFIAQRTPRVSLKPTICSSTLLSAVYIGVSGNRERIFLASPSICFRSIRNEIGVQPELNARSMTFGLSAIKIPF